MSFNVVSPLDPKNQAIEVTREGMALGEALRFSKPQELVGFDYTIIKGMEDELAVFIGQHVVDVMLGLRRLVRAGSLVYLPDQYAVALTTPDDEGWIDTGGRVHLATIGSEVRVVSAAVSAIHTPDLA
jgi:hypothetical protein